MMRNVVVGMLAILLVCAGVSQAETYIGATSDWSTNSNWQDGTTPGNSVSFNTLYVSTNSVCNYTATQGTCTVTGDFNVGRNTNGGNGTLNILGGTLQFNTSWAPIVGQLCTGVLNINGGSFVQVNNKGFTIGNGTNGNGTVNLLSGSLVLVSTSNIKIGADPGAGTMNISGGTASLASAPVFGAAGKINYTAGSTGSLTITGANYAYYAGLYAAGKLKYDGSNISSFDSVFAVSGETLVAGTGAIIDRVPASGAVNVPINQILSWTVADPNVKYIDLYLGTQSDPNLSLISANKKLSFAPATTTSYVPVLDYNATYYWKINIYEPNTAPGATDYILHTGPITIFSTVGISASVTPVSPALTVVDSGTSVVLSVVGTNATTYQWYKVGSPSDILLTNGTKYAGVTTNTLTISGVVQADEGNYYCQVDNTLPGTAPVNSVSGLVMTKRLVIHYPLDTIVSGKTPDVVSGYDMTLVSDGGGADFPTLTSGKIGTGALLFNNSNSADPNNTWGQYATAGDVDIEAMGNGFSIEFWMNFAGDNGTTGGVIARRNNWGAGQMMWDVEMRPTGNIYFATNGTQTSEVPTVKNTWTHIAITHDGVSTARVYVNGEFKAQATNVAYWGGVNSPLMLAAANYDSVTGLAGNFFNGMLDDVMVYNYVRNTAQIAQDYLAVNGGWVCNTEGTVPMTYDFNHNCQVDLADFALLAAEWLNSNRIYLQ